MAYALVSAGTGVQGSGAFPSPTFGTTTTANNLLVLPVVMTGASTEAVNQPTGWSTAFDFISTNTRVALFYQIAAGSDTAPTLSGTIGGTQKCEAQLVEFSGNATSAPLDQNNTAGWTSGTTLAATAASSDAAGGELVFFAFGWQGTAAIITVTMTLNNGATANSTYANNGVNSGTHYFIGYGITTGNSSADSATAGSFGSPTHAAVGLASFLAAGAAAGQNADLLRVRAPNQYRRHRPGRGRF